jgi:phage repressor protein C with HTH and peptisase S24 domain
MIDWNDRLVALLKERKMSVADLARAIDGPDFEAVKERLYKYAKTEKKVPVPRGLMMANIARALGVTEQYLRYGSDTADKVSPPDTDVTRRQPPQSLDVFVPRELPFGHSGAAGVMGLYGTTSAGKGALLLDNEPFEQIQRSQSLVNVKDPYAVVVDGDSMVPALRHGYVVHINPHLKARPDDICIFQSERDGTRLACIKALRKQTETHWHVTQYNPPADEKADFTLKKSEWPLAHVVVYIDPRRR